MRILGIDPGVATVGFGVIDSEGGRQRMVRYGAITTPAGMPLAARLVQIGGDLEQLIRQFQPDEMSIEELFFSKNITTGIAVAHGRGVLLYTAEKLPKGTLPRGPLRMVMSRPCHSRVISPSMGAPDQGW